MNKELRFRLENIAKKEIKSEDPSHSFNHALGVLSNSLKIATLLEKRGKRIDLDVLTAAALLHDCVNRKKSDPESRNDPLDSAQIAEKLLLNITRFPQDKIEQVKEIIATCSFTNGLPAKTYEGQILQDADMLQATGCVGILRFAASTEREQRDLFNFADPSAQKRFTEPNKYSIDALLDRATRLPERMNTLGGKVLAKQRLRLVREFTKKLRQELKINDD